MTTVCRQQVLEAARKYRSPVMIQFSNGGAQFLAGKSLENPKETQDACVLGSIAVRKQGISFYIFSSCSPHFHVCPHKIVIYSIIHMSFHVFYGTFSAAS
jgi:fructose/tagatose bisphosphate aldolase